MADTYGPADYNMLGLRIWKVKDLDREQLLAALKLTDQHLIIEGVRGNNPIIANPEALDKLIEKTKP